MVKLKREVMETAGVTGGDSLNESRHVVSSPAKGVALESFPFDRDGPPVDPLAIRKAHATAEDALDALGHKVRYVEVQHYNGLKVGDIEEVAFTGGKPDARTQAALDREGIPWRLIP